jgi:hypothetical protein
MFVCVYSGFVPCDGLIPHPRSPTDCVKDQETEKAAMAQQRTAEPLFIIIIIIIIVNKNYIQQYTLFYDVLKMLF